MQSFRPVALRSLLVAALGAALPLAGCGDTSPTPTPSPDVSADFDAASDDASAREDLTPPPSDTAPPPQDLGAPTPDVPAASDGSTGADASAPRDVVGPAEDRRSVADAPAPPPRDVPTSDVAAADVAAFDAGPVACGANADCPPDFYCVSATCGGRGACVARPRICTRDPAPVCGCNRRTYINPCEAAADGQNVASRGECVSAIDAGASDRPPSVCTAVLCGPGTMCCDAPGAAFYGMCYDPRCLSCCMPRVAVDAGLSRCSTVRCAAGYTCCARPGSPNDGTCFLNTCVDCCR